MFEDYTEFGERVGDFGQVGEEMLFGVEYRDVLEESAPLRRLGAPGND